MKFGKQAGTGDGGRGTTAAASSKPQLVGQRPWPVMAAAAIVVNADIRLFRTLKAKHGSRLKNHKQRGPFLCDERRTPPERGESWTTARARDHRRLSSLNTDSIRKPARVAAPTHEVLLSSWPDAHQVGHEVCFFWAGIALRCDAVCSKEINLGVVLATTPLLQQTDNCMCACKARTKKVKHMPDDDALVTFPALSEDAVVVVHGSKPMRPFW
ncbi:hypothetical protein QBC47DRAFT_24912 [Echria macrotheca]|uniref:Uncharacterized protein n=1 Tax=Echria macrotheca TaxID=438768 RepID=A0AAJ0BSM2_9PEZI|nr:hypothetical protein QBC47DRAFT_24912 [Echria macrotheca]